MPARCAMKPAISMRWSTIAGGTAPLLRLHLFLNTVFAGIERCERALIRAGVRFPFGDSLMVVAGKP